MEYVEALRALGALGLRLGVPQLFAVFLARFDQELPKWQGEYIRSNIISASNHSINTRTV